MKMYLSLIICTYMRPDAVCKLLKSIESQVVFPDEIIIVDSSTNEDTKNALGLSNLELPIRYFLVDEKYRGLTKQRNFGIEQLYDQTEVVAFLDDDIVLTPEYFKVLISGYLEDPECVGIGGFIDDGRKWDKLSQRKKIAFNDFVYDGYITKDTARFVIRKLLGLNACIPGIIPPFAHVRPVSSLPPSGKRYKVEFFMGGAASYRISLLRKQAFSEYFEGYGLYEDLDFTYRASLKGSLYVDTNARLFHYHEPSGRPNQYSYGKMVVRNGWYVWRLKNPNPKIIDRFKWCFLTVILMLLRFFNVLTAKQRKQALSEGFGRLSGLFSLVFNKPRVRYSETNCLKK